MYKLYIDGKLAYHPNLEECSINSGKATQELNKKGSLIFNISKTNVCYSKIRKMKSIVTFYDDDYRVMRCRVQDMYRDFYNRYKVICEGELTFLSDSVVRPYEFKGSVEEYFTFLISEHNKQVDTIRQFKIGRCTVTDPNDYITRANSNYPKIWEELNEKLLDRLGGYLWTREEQDGVYIDYLEDFDTINLQNIEFGKNMLDFEEAVKGQNIASAIIPLGTKLQDAEGNDTGKRLTIADINDDIDYVFEEAAVEKYGLIFKTVIFDDVTLPENLMRKGREELQNYINLIQSIEIAAIDLHNADKEIRSFRVGNYTKIISEPHSLNETLLTRKRIINLLDPTDGTLSLGDERKTFIDKQIESDKNVGSMIEKVERVEADYKVNEKVTESIKGDLEDLKAKKMYRLYIVSTNGNTFKNGNIDTILQAVVYSWDEEVTSRLDDNQFIWSRQSGNTEDDKRWNAAHAGGTKQIQITGEDVRMRATFFCDLIDTTTRQSLLEKGE